MFILNVGDVTSDSRITIICNDLSITLGPPGTLYYRLQELEHCQKGFIFNIKIQRVVQMFTIILFDVCSAYIYGINDHICS